MDSVDNLENSGIEIKVYDEPMQVRKMMLEGSVDFAVLPSTMAALLYNKGMDYRMVAVPVWGTLYLCGNDTLIKNWRDLKGKKVYLMARGMTPDVLFQYLMNKNGLDKQDVDLDYRFPTHIDLANATMAGRAETSVISEPYLSIALSKNPSLHILMNLSDEWHKVEGVPLPETTFVCRSEYLEKHKKQVDELVEAYASSVNWVNANIAEAASLSVKYGIVNDLAAAASSIPRSNLRVEKAETVKNEMRDYLKVFYEMDTQIIGGKMPDDRFYE